MLVLLVASVAFFAAGTSAADDGETKFKAALFPCLPVGEDDAGGEAEWEGDTLKVELWGASDLAGKTLDVFAVVLRAGVGVRVFVSSITVDQDGGFTGLAARVELEEIPDLLESEWSDPADDRTRGPLFSSDRGCE